MRSGFTKHVIFSVLFSFYSQKPNAAAECLSLLLHILEVSGLKVCPETAVLTGILWLASVLQGNVSVVN